MKPYEEIVSFIAKAAGAERLGAFHPTKAAEERVAQLEAESARLRDRLAQAEQQAAKMLDQVVFLRQQHVLEGGA